MKNVEKIIDFMYNHELQEDIFVYLFNLKYDIMPNSEELNYFYSNFSTSSYEESYSY